MMINGALKYFIEHNVDLLDTDINKFLSDAFLNLRHSDFEKLLEILDSSDIVTEPYKTEVFMDALDYYFFICLDNTPLIYFVKSLFMNSKTFFGLSEDQVVSFIENNKTAWSKNMRLEKSGATSIIRTNV